MIPCDDDPPPDLSPSDHRHHQKSHDFKIICEEKADAVIPDIDLFADLDANNNPQSSFSIRDYVFNLRSKNIARSWPFSHKILQICLKHEVKNILPPFHSLDSVRNNSSNEEIISSCNKKSKLELTFESKRSKKLSQTHIQQDLGQTKSKKTETETAIAMASKICPVCKIFSSSSNTTLNAHIDQCLSGESTMKWTANPKEIIKHRIKPRIKMRLMVDIYKTAPHCTIEELDARNGTSWANNSNFPDQEIEFEATTIVDHKGDENIRSKVRILSVPKADNYTSNDGFQKKGGKSGKVFLRKKKSKNQERKPDQSYLKQSPNSKKSSEVTTVPEENVGNRDDLPIVRPPWACSKRTGLAKMKLSVTIDKCFSKSDFKPASSSSNKTGILSQQNSQETKSLTPSKLLFAKKRSHMLTKPSSKHFSKRGTLSQNSCVDPSVSFLVKGSDVRSKGRKTASKINLKRKLLALERGQDSLKHKCWIKEDTSGKTSCKSMNLLEVKMNEKMEICRPENSVSSRSLNEDSLLPLKTCVADPSCGIESVTKEERSIEEQVSSMQVSRSSNNMFDSTEQVIDVTDAYHDMSDSPNSTISNPSLTRSDSDKFSVRSISKNNEKYELVTLKSMGDWQSNSQSQTTSFNKNDHQPCCCSRKEIASSTYHDQSTLLRKHDVESFYLMPQMPSISKFPTSPPLPRLPPVKLPCYHKCDSAASASKPVIRLMGKNLTVVNTDEDKVNCGQNGFKSQDSIFHPPNSLKNHSLNTMFQGSTYEDYYVHGSPHVGPMINNGSFQACSPFMDVENNWNCKPATGSSSSSAIYSPSSFL